MNTKNLVLVGTDKKPATVEFNASVLANKLVASNYFGTWYKNNANSSEIVAWCTAQIEARQREISNLQKVKSFSQEEMVAGMDPEVLRTILEKMTSPQAS